MKTSGDGAGYWLLAIVIAGAAVRLWGLGAESFWHDESWTWGIVEGRPGHVFERLRNFDAHPPLFFLLLRTWSFFGAFTSEAWLRLLSALFGIAAIPLLYRLGRRIGGRGTGLAAALFLAASPFALNYAQEARSYTVLFVLCLTSLMLLVSLLQTRRLSTQILFGLVTAAIMLTHYMGIFFLASEAVAVLILARERRGFVRDVGVAALIAGVVFLPWLPTFIDHARQVDRSFWIPVPTREIVERSLTELIAAPSPYLWGLGDAAVKLFWGLTFFAPLLLRTRLAWALFAMAIIPPAGQLLVSIERPLFYTQTFQFILIPIFLLAALAIARLSTRFASIAALALALTLVPAVIRHHTELTKENWRDGEALIAQAIAPGERVIVPQGYLAINLSYYGSLAKPASGWTEAIRPIDAGAMLTPAYKSADVVTELAQQRTPGVWVVTRYTEDAEWQKTLGTDFAPDTMWLSRGVVIRHYKRR